MSSSASSSPPGPSGNPLLAAYPHLHHYVYQLVSSAGGSSLAAPQHPLSVSSSGSGSGSGSSSDDDDAVYAGKGKAEGDQTLTGASGGKTARADSHSDKADSDGIKSETRSDRSAMSPPMSQERKLSGKFKIPDKEELLRTIVNLLNDEKEEDVKDVLKDKLPSLAKDENVLDQICLDLMHKHKDDIDHVPYQPSLAPTRVRSSPSIAHATPLRPFTPTRVPSFRAHTPLGRSHSPAPGAGRPGGATPTGSQPGTPTGVGGGFAFGGPFASPKASHSPLPGGSPLSSPRLLNAKAATYNPMGSPSIIPRSSPGLPPPSSLAAASDPWSQIGRAASPAMAAPGLTRTSSNLAIAAPLTPSNEDTTFAFHGNASPVSGAASSQNRHSGKAGSESDDAGVDDIFASSSHPYRRSGLLPDDEEDDEFSPFGSPIKEKSTLRTSPTNRKLNLTAKAFDPTRSALPDAFHPASSMAPGMSMGVPSYFDQEAGGHGGGEGSGTITPGGTTVNSAHAEELSAGMTPLDVLQSVFTSLPAGELEEALDRSNYDFEGAMAILIAQNGGRSGQSTPQRVASPGPRPPFQRVASGGGGPPFMQGGRVSGTISPRYGMSGTRSPGPGIPPNGGIMVVNGQRVCRYFLAGECRRADCRFSHDVDRALCRFWLRGQCAKGDQCEFVHTLPNVDPHMLSHAMSRVELSQDGTSRHGPRTPPVDDFPDLHGARGQRNNFDPSRNRFANALKKPMPQGPMPVIQVTGGRFAPAARRPFTPPISGARTPPINPQPRPSPRIKLRPPTLLPTLPTGAVVNDAYMEARAGALRLGHARNACLARAADAWRRGDGAAAKRFSREANVLNERMTAESSEAASKLIRDRRAAAQEAIQNRGNWSDDPSDRAARGKECGGGLGVIMGVASAKAVGLGGSLLSTEERTECLLDLHALHANEGVELLEEFLTQLERENFFGLAYVIIGDERHVGQQDPARGVSRFRLSTGVKQFLGRWQFCWSEGGGVICVDPVTHI